jgi:hypothetical protein
MSKAKKPFAPDGASAATPVPQNTPPAEPVPAFTVADYHDAHTTLGAVAFALVACGHSLPGPEGAAVLRAAGDVDRTAAWLRARRWQREAPDTVTPLYAAWLSARGKELVTPEGGGEGDDGEGSDAWQIAQDAIDTPAGEPWEIAHKVEILRWMLASGDIDRHVKERAFAAILADLEG